MIALAALLAFARVAEAFVLLRASELGLATALVPLVLIVMNVAYALSAWPAGAYSDRFGRKPVLACGLGLLLLADLLLARAADPWTALLGALVWGLHLGATQGLLAALVADRAPAQARGAAFGWLHLGTGLATVLAGALGGWLWTRFGAGAAYAAGAVCAALALVLLGCAARARRGARAALSGQGQRWITLRTDRAPVAHIAGKGAGRPARETATADDGQRADERGHAGFQLRADRAEARAAQSPGRREGHDRR